MCKGTSQNLQDLYKSYVQSLGLTVEARSFRILESCRPGEVAVQVVKPAKHIATEAVKPIPETCRSVRHGGALYLQFLEAKTCEDKQGTSV